MGSWFDNRLLAEVLRGMDLRHLIFVIIFYLCAGTFFSLGFVKQSQVGRRYFIYHGLGLSFLCLVPLLLFGRSVVGPSAFVALIGFLGLSAGYALTAVRFPKAAWTLYSLAAITALFAMVEDLEAFRQVTLLGWPFVVNAGASMLLLGFTMAAMLLGHWYLVQPRLSITELGRLTAVFIALVVFRFLYSTYLAWGMVEGMNEMQVYRYLLGSTQGIFVTMRWAWGCLAPLALSYFIWNTVKIRATQSATGILYVAVVCVLIGEIISQYLTFFHALPL